LGQEACGFNGLTATRTLGSSSLPDRRKRIRPAPNVVEARWFVTFFTNEGRGYGSLRSWQGADGAEESFARQNQSFISSSPLNVAPGTMAGIRPPDNPELAARIISAPPTAKRHISFVGRDGHRQVGPPVNWWRKKLPSTPCIAFPPAWSFDAPPLVGRKPPFALVECGRGGCATPEHKVVG